MTTFTSASANKKIKALSEEKNLLLAAEQRDCTYVLAIDEQEEPPVYSYNATRAQIDEIDAQVLKIRHALHVFNMNTVLPVSKLTIDECLIRMAQMSQEANRLSWMRQQNEKQRVGSNLRFGTKSTTEYEYANYDIQQAKADYLALSDKIAQLQLELDLANQTKTFEVDL